MLEAGGRFRGPAVETEARKPVAAHWRRAPLTIAGARPPVIGDEKDSRGSGCLAHGENHAGTRFSAHWPQVQTCEETLRRAARGLASALGLAGGVERLPGPHREPPP
jgi:hypothetical protein